MPIRILDSQLISQIAAGEVVERPASVVKELVENSLDAGARSVTVELEAGGMRLIRVRDDGIGIGRDELPLALTRHATSKIGSLDELQRVASLGFRGEALPSVASVSTLSLTSRARDADQGYTVSGRGADEVLTPRPAPHPQGTTVEVRELFARVPARRKFLRTETTEFRHAQKVFRTIALSRFDVAFRLRHNGREVVHLPATTLPEQAERRVAAVCGEDFLEHAVHVRRETGGLELDGWIATPGFSRSQADLQYSFVNARMIRDRLFNHAVRRAYEDVLHNQRHPAFVLYFGIDPGQVDVNAHPAKAEVRFRESRLVHDFLFRTLHEALTAADDGADGHDHGHRVTLPTRQPAAPSPPPPAPAIQPRQGGLGLSVAENRAAYRFQAPTSGPSPQPVAPAVSETPPMGFALGQLHGIYILAENADGLILVDMHAAHERILYERMKRSYHEGGIRSQPLLVPATLRVSETEAELAEHCAADLAELGMEITRGGPSAVTLRALPALLGDVDAEALLRDVLADLAAESGSGRVARAVEQLLGDMGCRAAIKAGRRLSLTEMNALLRDMEGTERAGHCNHGRPSWVQVDLAGLDRMFMRGQ